MYIKEKTRSEVPPSFVITYGVRCDCDPDFDFDQTISEQEGLLTNLIKVKTETDYELSLDDLQKFHPLFANDGADVQNYGKSIEPRDTVGGTSKSCHNLLEKYRTKKRGKYSNIK